LENLAVLCLEDHNRTQTRGGFGRHLSASEVREYRRGWYEKIERRRSSIRQELLAEPISPAMPWREPSLDVLQVFLGTLPDVRARLERRADPGWMSGVTLEMNGSTYEVIDGLVAIWLVLAKWYPPHHFGLPPEAFISDYQARVRTH